MAVIWTLTKKYYIPQCHELFAIYMIASDQHPMTSLFQIAVRYKGFLKSASFPNAQMYGGFNG